MPRWIFFLGSIKTGRALLIMENFRGQNLKDKSNFRDSCTKCEGIKFNVIPKYLKPTLEINPYKYQYQYQNIINGVRNILFIPGPWNAAKSWYLITNQAIFTISNNKNYIEELTKHLKGNTSITSIIWYGQCPTWVVN